MKKFFKFVLMVFALVAVSNVMVSCGDDDTSTPTSGDNTAGIVVYGSGISATKDVDKAAVSEIMNYICNQIGSGTQFSDGLLYVPYKFKDKAASTLKTLGEDLTWADNICKKGDNVRVSIVLSLNKSTVFTYLYPRSNGTATFIGTEGESTWKIVLTDEAKANPNREGYKKGTVTVPEGMEIAAGEYAGEWHTNSINGYHYFFSDKFYGDAYSEDNAYIRLYVIDASDGSCGALVYLRYQEEGTVKQKSHQVVLTKE